MMNTSKKSRSRPKANKDRQRPEHTEVVIPAANIRFMEKMAEQEAHLRERQEAAGDIVTAQELARRLRISMQAVSKAVRAQRMFSLESGNGRPLLPAFFADPALNRRQAESVCRTLDELPGSAKWQFFTMPKLSLGGRTPLGALVDGDVQDVLRAARAFRER